MIAADRDRREQIPKFQFSIDIKWFRWFPPLDKDILSIYPSFRIKSLSSLIIQWDSDTQRHSIFISTPIGSGTISNYSKWIANIPTFEAFNLISSVTSEINLSPRLMEDRAKGWFNAGTTRRMRVRYAVNVRSIQNWWRPCLHRCTGCKKYRALPPDHSCAKVITIESVRYVHVYRVLNRLLSRTFNYRRRAGRSPSRPNFRITRNATTFETRSPQLSMRISRALFQRAKVNGVQFAYTRSRIKIDFGDKSERAGFAVRLLRKMIPKPFG